MCLSRNSIASHRNYSKTIPNRVLAEIPSPLLSSSVLLPLESQQCPLTLASVLACVDSVHELQF